MYLVSLVPMLLVGGERESLFFSISNFANIILCFLSQISVLYKFTAIFYKLTLIQCPTISKTCNITRWLLQQLIVTAHSPTTNLKLLDYSYTLSRQCCWACCWRISFIFGVLCDHPHHRLHYHWPLCSVQASSNHCHNYQTTCYSHHHYGCHNNLTAAECPTGCLPSCWD